MEIYDLDDMQSGWFIGDFEPSIVRTKDLEVGLHRHPKGEVVESHPCAASPEVKVVVRGRLRAADQIVNAGQVLVFRTREVCEIEFLEDSEVLAVKWRSIPRDERLADRQMARAGER